jgi:hypothetical protein
MLLEPSGQSGFVPKEKVGDELIAGTERGGAFPPERDPVADEVPA